MSLTKRILDDDAAAERLQRGWDEVYYGEDWPSDQECLDDEQRLYSSEPIGPDDQA